MPLDKGQLAAENSLDVHFKGLKFSMLHQIGQVEFLNEETKLVGLGRDYTKLVVPDFLLTR